MLILAVDTTTWSGSVALLKGTKLLAEVNLESPLTHSEKLLPAIDFVLKANSLDIRHVEAFALAVGPGSFTGIRIGLSTVKSFAFASGKPVAPVSSLQALAFKMRSSAARLVSPVIDAKKGEIYAALFELKAQQQEEVVAQGAYKPDLFFSLLPAHRIIHFIGNGLESYKQKIFQYFKDKARFSPRTYFIAYEVGLLGYELLIHNKGLSFEEVEPLYFRKSQAEEKD